MRWSSCCRHLMSVSKRTNPYIWRRSGKKVFTACVQNTWVISEVLHTVCFLFKNEFILKNTFTGLHVISIVFYHSASTFGQVFYSCLNAFVLMCLITQVTSLDTSSMLLKRFPLNSFFGTSQSLMGSAHQTLTCSQNWRNHCVGKASEALRRCLTRWPE
jgi:hypothetical protein